MPTGIKPPEKNTCLKNPRIENSKPPKILRSSPFPRGLSMSNLLQEQCQEIYQNSDSGNRHQTPDFFHKLTSKPPSSKTCYIFQTTIEMENVVDCQLMEEKSNGKSLFRVIYFSQNARDFKHYDFEAESDMSGKCFGVLLGWSFVKHCIGTPLQNPLWIGYFQTFVYIKHLLIG